MPVLQLDNRREALAKEEAPCHLDLSKLIQAGTKTFFNNPALSDLTLVCPDGRALHCHSVILAAASRRLAAALKQGNWTPGQQMPVKGVDSDALETLICAFYTAECPLELGRVPALYDAAVKLEVPSLAPALEQYLSSALQPHNCCQVLEICLNVGAAQLADLTLDWIRSRVADVVPSPEFRSSRLETAACICKDLAQRSQLMGLQAAVSWLSAVGGRASLAGVFAEATGLSVDAIQAVAVSGAALGPMGHGGGGGGGAAGGGGGATGGLLHLSHGGSHGLGGHAESLLGPGAGAGSGPSLNLQQGLGLSGSGEPSLSAGMSLGLGGAGGGSCGVQVLQLMPSAGGGPQAVLVLPQGGGAGAMSGENGPLGPHGHHIGNLQSLLSLHGGGGGGAGKGGGGGGLGDGGLGGGGGPAGFGLDALADAAEGERVQKRMRAAAAGGGAGGFATPAAESGSATSMHSDMSGGAQRMAGIDDSGVPPFHHQHTQQQQRLARGDVNYAALQQQQQQHPTGAQTGTGVHARQQLLLQQQQAEQQQAPRGKPAGGRGAGGRRRRGTSASDDDEDYAPSGGRGGGGGAAGGSGRSRAQEIVYDADAPMDDPSAAAGNGGNASAGSGPGDDDAGGNTGAGSGASPKVGGAVSGGSAGGGGAGSAGGGGGAGGNPPVLMTGRRAPAQKGMCHVQGCHRSLVGLRDYYQRYKICEHHLKVSSVLKDGVAHRFCQQCGRFHPLSEFDGDRRSCRTMLQRHCHRRAKQKQELAEVLAQRFEEKQVAASMSAVVAAMARNAQAAGNVAGLSPMLQLQYLAGLPAAAAVAAAALDEEQLGALTAAAVRSGGSSAAVSDGSGASAKTGGAAAPAGGGGGGSRGRGSLPAGLHSPPSKAQLLEAMEQRARTQRVAAQQKKLLGLPTDVPLAAALAAAAAAAGGDLDAGGGHDGGNEVAGATEHNAPAGDGGVGRSDNDQYAGAMLQGPELGGGASGDDGGAGPLKQEAGGGAAGMGDDAS